MILKSRLGIHLARAELVSFAYRIDFSPRACAWRILLEPRLRIDQEALAANIDRGFVSVTHPALDNDAIRRLGAFLALKSRDLHPALCVVAFGPNRVTGFKPG